MANKQFFLDRETDPLNPALEVANKDELIKVYTDAGDLITDLGNLDDNEIAACEGNDFQNVYISNTITAGDLNVPTVDAVKTYVDSNIPATKIFGPFTLGSVDFTADNTYSDYPYKITITCVGIDDSYSASVNFSTADAHLGIFSPFAETGSDAVSFYASSIPSANVTVTSIVCTAIPDGVNEGGSTNAYKGIKYSTSETFTGNYWIDGKPIYRKVINDTTPATGNATFGANNNNKSVQIGETCDCIIDIRGFVEYVNDVNGMINVQTSDVQWVSVWGRGNSHSSMPNSLGLACGTASVSLPITLIVEYTKN